MPSVKCNLTIATAKTMGLIFLLFDIALAQVVPFGIPHCVQCILHGFTSVLFCILFIFADSKSVDLVVARSGFLLYTLQKL